MLCYATRLLCLTTELTQPNARNNGIKLYEKISSIHADLHQSDTATGSQLVEAKSSILQRLDEAARVESDKFTEQANTLHEIRLLAEPISDNHTKTMVKLEDLTAAMRVNEGRLQSITTFQATSIDVMSRVVRAELTGVVMPKVEEYLDSYKSHHSSQLKEIRRNLDQIASELGRSSVGEHSINVEQDSEGVISDLHVSDLGDAAFLPHHEPSNETMGLLSSENSNNLPVAQSWSRIWGQSWSFRWPIGILMVHISASQRKIPSVRREYQAFSVSKLPLKRHAYSVSIDFHPAPGLLMKRGLSIKCNRRQDHRGFYQISPKLSTFAIVPEVSDVFLCVTDNDIRGLRKLFAAGFAAPTDRNEFSWSLLHVSTCLV